MSIQEAQAHEQAARNPNNPPAVRSAALLDACQRYHEAPSRADAKRLVVEFEDADWLLPIVKNAIQWFKTQE
jgi:hypothetical protein